MKYSFSHLIIAVAGLLLMASCKKVENKVVFEGSTSPVLTSNLATNSLIPVSASTKDQVAINFTWTNPDYKFNTGVSSQNVNYTLQIDSAGNNFSGPKMQERSYSSDLSGSITQGDLNKMLIQMGFPFDQEGTFEVRLKSFLGTGSVAAYSNVLTFRAAPYLDVVVALPTSGKLYLVGGDAQLGAWQNGGSYSSQTQEFTRVDLTTFSITVNLSGGDNTSPNNQFLFVPVWGDWGHKFACKKTADQPATGGSFGYDWSDNFPGPPVAGTYKIVVDFKLGKYSVTKL